jgi:hypothetical protein
MFKLFSELRVDTEQEISTAKDRFETETVLAALNRLIDE